MWTSRHGEFNVASLRRQRIKALIHLLQFHDEVNLPKTHKCWCICNSTIHSKPSDVLKHFLLLEGHEYVQTVTEGLTVTGVFDAPVKCQT
jgi:hypothetical protein